MENFSGSGFFGMKNWPISVKITSIVVIMITIMLALIIIISDYRIKSSVSEQMGREFEITTQGLNEAFTEYIVIFINQIATLSLNNNIQNQIANQNSSYEDISSGLPDKILEIDEAWIKHKGKVEIAEKIITNNFNTNPSAHEVSLFTEHFSEQKEVLITDKFGALVAASSVTSDYYQGDELWWKEAWNNGQGGFYISTPQYDENINQIIIMLAFPVFSDQQEPIGIVRTSIIANNILTFLRNTEGGESGRAYIVNNKGEYVIRKNQQEFIKDLEFTNEVVHKHSGNGTTLNEDGQEVIYGYAKFDVSFVENFMVILKERFISEIDSLDWYFVYSQSTTEALAVMQVVNNSILVTGIILLVVFIIVIVIIINRILRPLIKIISLGNEVIQGDFSVNISQQSNDEIGKLSGMFSDLIKSLREMANVAKTISNGDLSSQIEPRSEKDEMGKAFAQMTIFLREQINEINKVVLVLTSSNSQLMATVAQVSTSSNETATTVSEVTTTIEEVKQTAEVSAQKAKNVAESANKSVSISENGIKTTEDSIEGMNIIQEQVKEIAETIIKLSEQSQTISEITDSVKDLAEQSNLLAVNASIEAAKAGEYGKGFGVVAQEIRVLADQSKQATRQINDILNEVQKAISSAVMATEQGGKAVEAGVQLAETSGDSISLLADSIAEASQSSAQIAASSHQQLTGMEQLASAMENIKQATHQNASGNKETEKAVENLKKIVEDLKELTGKYQL